MELCAKTYSLFGNSVKILCAESYSSYRSSASSKIFAMFSQLLHLPVPSTRKELLTAYMKMTDMIDTTLRAIGQCNPLL